jgi:hypothetical protein
MEQKKVCPEFGVTPRLVRNGFTAKNELLADGMRLTYGNGAVLRPVSETDLEVLLHDPQDPTRRKMRALMNGAMEADFNKTDSCSIEVPSHDAEPVKGLPESLPLQQLVEIALKAVIAARDERRARIQWRLQNQE